MFPFSMGFGEGFSVGFIAGSLWSKRKVRKAAEEVPLLSEMVQIQCSGCASLDEGLSDAQIRLMAGIKRGEGLLPLHRRRPSFVEAYKACMLEEGEAGDDFVVVLPDDTKNKDS